MMPTGGLLRLPLLRVLTYGALVPIGLMWTLPFLFPYKAPPVPSFRAEAIAMILGLLASATLMASAQRLPLPRIALLPLGFVLLLLLQVPLGKVAFYQQSLLAALYLIWAGALMVVGAMLRRELGLERVATALAWFLIAGLIGCCIIGLAQHLRSYAFLASYITMPSKGRLWGNLAQANHLADYMALGLASLIYLYATGRLRWSYAVALGGFAAYILSLTGSRSAWLYLIALAVLAAGFFAAERSRVNGRLLVAAVLVLAGLYLLPRAVEVVMPGDVAPAISAMDRLSPEALAIERPRIFQTASRMFLDSPLLGVGFRHFGLRFFYLNAEFPPPRLQGSVDNAHNLLLHVAAEFGAAGLAVLLIGVTAWVFGLLRQPRTPAFWWLLALAVVMALHSMLEYPLWYAYFLGVAAIVLGLGEARTLELAAAGGRLWRTRAVLAAMLVLGGLVWGQVVRDYLLLENFLTFRYRYLHASEEVNRHAKALFRELRRDSLLLPWAEVALARSIPIGRDELAENLTVNTRAMQAFPIDDVAYRQAMLLALAGEAVAAQRQWDLAVVSFPSYRQVSLVVLRRRVEQGVKELAPLLEYAEGERT